MPFNGSWIGLWSGSWFGVEFAPPPVVESGYLGGGPIEYLIDDDEEILAVIMAYMGMRNVH